MSNIEAEHNYCNYIDLDELHFQPLDLVCFCFQLDIRMVHRETGVLTLRVNVHTDQKVVN